MQFAISNSSFIGTNTDGVYIWGVQSEVSSASSPSIYVPKVNSQIVSSAVKTVSPGIVYSSGIFDEVTYNTGSGVVVNLYQYSQSFSNWTKSTGVTSITDNTAIAPDGTLTASTVVSNTASNQYITLTGVGIISGKTYTRSIYAKAGTVNYIIFEEYDTSGGPTYFDLVNGTIYSVFAGDTAVIQNVGNGWYRCAVTRTYSASNSLTGTFYVGGQWGNGPGGTLYLWGAQWELASTASIYQPIVTSVTPNFSNRTDKQGNNYNPNIYDEMAATFTWTFTASTVGYSSTGWQGIQSKFTGGLADSNYFDTSSFWGSNKEDYASITAVFPTTYNISNVYLGPVDAAANGGW
jgi:hypothetical protein